MSKSISKEVMNSILLDSHSLDIPQLGEKYGLSDFAIRKILWRSFKKPKKEPRLLSREVLLNALKDGWLSSADLCKRCNASYYFVMKSLRAHKIVQGRKPSVRHRVHPSGRAFKVLGYIMANPEMSFEAVSKQFLCTKEFVSQVAAMARQEGIIK